jgi:hypothetical protein
VDRMAIKAEIKRLVKDGSLLREREFIATRSAADRKKMMEWLDKDPEREQLLKKPYFESEYQSWYSPALRVVEQLLPDRYNEFRDLYKNERRKKLDYETYRIADYISGILPYGFEASRAAGIATRCLGMQVAILSTADARFDSVLTDIGRALHAEILDDELDAAKNLLIASHIRSAGVVAGVALEGHLKKLIADHKVPFRKKAMLSNLNDALKDAGIYDGPQWRQIQYLTDIRNLCGHKSGREPERTEVDALINEVARIVKNLF